ncbi:hypothetical protein I312_106329 [Cryptococcus bacillisporus CA1280]|uniref:uncharacterized protein n=1 Tax=Cryptococcus bacillisporus CA1280 TaxID=1296109 RepID=UPI003367EB87
MSLVKKKGLGIEICFVKSLSLDLVFIDLTHLSRERKKKREVEGGVVKEGNFVIPLDVGNADEELAELGGLRVF